jgi:hypothetical protein
MEEDGEAYGGVAVIIVLPLPFTPSWWLGGKGLRFLILHLFHKSNLKIIKFLLLIKITILININLSIIGKI